MTAGDGTPPAVAAWWNGRLAWWGIFAVGVCLRLILFSGYGLGDDPNYLSAYRGIVLSGGWDRNEPYSNRFGIWMPVVLCMHLFGPTEIGFVGAITACSIINLVLVYALARQEWDRPTGLLAMALLAVLPLDVTSATLFANDIILATYSFSALWLYREALSTARGTAVRVAAAVGAAACLFAGFVTKPYVAFVGVMIVLESLPRLRRSWPYTLLAGGLSAALVGGYLGWQWVRFGDAMHHITISAQHAIFSPYSREVLLDYPRMLFLPNDYGSFFTGLYAHVLLLLALVFAFRIFRCGKWLAYTLVYLCGLAAMPAHKEQGHWVTLTPHIFRYLCGMAIPLVLALTAYLRELIRWRPAPGLAFTAALVVVSIVQSVQLSWPTRNAFGEQRRTNAFLLATFPDERVWSDYGFLGRLISFASDQRGVERIRGVLPEEPVRQAAELAKVTDGVVVTGGGRLPWYNCIRCALSVSAFTPPPTWTLVTMHGEEELGPHRKEPMRIWRVSPAVARADELFAQRVDDASRLALLGELIASRDYPVAAEVGRRLVEQGVAPRGSVAYMTGLACARAGKPACARAHYAKALDDVLSPGEARQIIVTTTAGGTPADLALAREWLARFRERFPNETIDAATEEALSGFAEARALLQAARYAEAAAKFRDIRARTEETAFRRKQAHYFAALALFRVPGKVDDATREADAYRRLYGEDEFAIELRYREGEARITVDPAGARRIFTDFATGAPDTLWGRESQRQLTALGADRGGTP